MGQIQHKSDVLLGSETENSETLGASEPPDTKPSRGLGNPLRANTKLLNVKLHEFRAGAHSLNGMTCVH